MGRMPREGAEGVKGRGFIVHAALTSTLDGLGSEARTAVIGAAYARVRGLNDYALPKKFAMFEFLVAGIASEAAAICAPPEKKQTRAPAKTGAQRTAEYRARLAARGGDCDESDECDEVTNVTKCDANKEVSKEVSKSGTRVTFVTREDVRTAAHNLSVPFDFAFDYFMPEMEKLDWMARGAAGRMFRVTRANLASVLRGWWEAEKRKKTPPASSGTETADVAPSITDGEIIS